MFPGDWIKKALAAAEQPFLPVNKPDKAATKLLVGTWLYNPIRSSRKCLSFFGREDKRRQTDGGGGGGGRLLPGTPWEVWKCDFYQTCQLHGRKATGTSIRSLTTYVHYLSHHPINRFSTFQSHLQAVLYVFAISSYIVFSSRQMHYVQ